MKTNLFIIGMAFVLFMMWGCKDSDTTTELIVDTEVLEATSDGGVVTIHVTCNKVAKATIEYDNPAESGWIFMLPTVLLNGNGILELRVQSYAGILTNRNATITIAAENESKTVKLTQLAKESAGFSREGIVASDNAKSYTVTVTCNTTWNATVNSEAASWCTLANTTGGQGENPLTVNVAALSGSGAFESRSRLATITVSTGKVSATLKVYQGFGEMINGLYWAYCNVGEPGQFSNGPDDPGLLYQYNSRIGYPIEGGVPAGYPTGYVDNGVSTWTDEQNPSPGGWRVPTAAEIDALVGSDEDKNFVWAQPEASGFNKAGIIAGIPPAEASQATKIDLRGGIFIPISGYRHVETGVLTSAWNVVLQSITRPGQNWDRYMYGFWDYGMYKYGGGPDGSNRSALPIRCVADITE